MSFTDLRLRWSIHDYHRMINTGILADHRVEWIAGEIHSFCDFAPLTVGWIEERNPTATNQ